MQRHRRIESRREEGVGGIGSDRQRVRGGVEGGGVSIEGHVVVGDGVVEGGLGGGGRGDGSWNGSGDRRWNRGRSLFFLFPYHLHLLDGSKEYTACFK